MNLINKDSLLQTLDWNGIIAYQPIEAERAARDMIESMPIVDAVPVVHCKECKHYSLTQTVTGKPVKVCFKYGIPNQTKEDDFCSYGEKGGFEMKIEDPKNGNKTLKIYGASDDLVEVENTTTDYDEIGCYSSIAFITFTDGTQIRVFYPEEGMAIWKIEVLEEGTAHHELTVCTDEDADIHSDIFIIAAEIESVRLEDM